MIRSFYALSALVFLAATVGSCNTPSCGPGTKQFQAANGDLQCIPVDSPAPLTDCATDGGTVDDVAGHCVSHIKCDPDTTVYDPVTGVCVGTGMGGGCKACPSPIPSGSICVTGGVVDFQTNKHLKAGDRALRIGIYEPLAFLSDPNTPPLDKIDSTDQACFTFVIATPGNGLIALKVDDPQGTTPAEPLVGGGSGATVVTGTKYNVDAYMVKKSTYDNYIAADATFMTAGAYVGCYYNTAPPAATNLVFNETDPPATGVHLLANASTMASTKYLKADGTIDSTLTATGATKGCAVIPGSGVTQYSGMGGGPTKWETVLGGTTGGIVFIGRFHNCDNAMAGTTTCQ